MGRKHIVPYGLYRAMSSSPPSLRSAPAFRTTTSPSVWEALRNMFEHDRSAARGEMAARKLIVFKHATALGNAPAHDLFDRVTVDRVRRR